MKTRHICRSEGDAERLVEGIIVARLKKNKSAFVIEVPHPDWIGWFQHWILEACEDRVEDSNETYVDITFDVRSPEVDEMERKLDQMSDEEINEFLSELLDEIQDELDDEDTNDE